MGLFQKTAGEQDAVQPESPELLRSPTVYTEDCEPLKKHIKSDVALFALVAVGALVLTTGVSFVVYKLELSIIVAQVILLMLFMAITLVLYRERLVTYRYTVTEKSIRVERVVGKKITPEVTVRLAAITHIRPYEEIPGELLGNLEQFYHGKKKDSTGVEYRAGGLPRTLLITMSEEMKTALVSQWQKSRKK